MSDFHHQPAVGFEVVGRFVHDAPHEVQPVVAAGERNARLAAIFRGQRAHRFFCDVRRIGYDEIVAPSFDTLVQVRSHEIDTFAECVVRNVAACDGKRVARHIGSTDLRAWEAVCEQYREAAGSRA
jgi:hypothetical protein